MSHAIPYLDTPLIAVATGIPDWLSVVDRKIRARKRLAVPHLDSDDLVLRDVARGIVAHVDDDQWFHAGECFVAMNLALAMQLRERLPGDAGFRPMFVGHIVIEMLLDAIAIKRDRGIAQRYFAAIAAADHDAIETAVNAITGKPATNLSDVITRFGEVQFLYDYLTPVGLLHRLNQVMDRVGLANLPDDLTDWLVEVEDLVESDADRLLPGRFGTT